MADKKNNWANPLAKVEEPPKLDAWGRPIPEPEPEPMTPEPEPAMAAWPSDNKDLLNGPIRTTGVGLKEGEIKALDQIGKLIGAENAPIARNALIRWAVRDFIKRYRAGTIDLDTEEKPVKVSNKRLKMS